MKQKQPTTIVFSDSHVRKGKTEEFTANMEELISLAKKHGIKNLVFAGDLFYSSSHQTLDVLLAVHRFIRRLKDEDISCIAIPGNHDKVDRDSDDSYLDIFECSHFIVRNRESFIIGDVMFHVFDYRSETGTFRDEWSKFMEESADEKKQILILHQGINGGLTTHSDANKELSPELFKDWDNVLVGHYHDRNKVSDNIQYIGSSRQFNFGEDEMKGYTLVYDDGSCEFIQNEANMRYITLNTNKKKLEKTLSQAKEYIDDRYYVRLNIDCKESEKKTIDKAAIYDMGISQVNFNIANEDIDVNQTAAFEKFDKEAIAGEYVDFCEKKETDPQLGLKYLKQIQ